MKHGLRQEGQHSAISASPHAASCYTGGVTAPPFNPSWPSAALLLVAHGSSRYPQAADDLLRLAERLRHERRFARVDVAFWRQEPQLSPEQLQGKRVFVLPFFAGIGKHSRELIPERLGLTGAVTRRGAQTVLYCQPVGCHADLPALIDRRARRSCQELGFAVADSALLLIAHGSKAGGASQTPEAVAGALRRLGHFAEVGLVFLEQEPLAATWPAVVGAAHIIAQPLLLSAGMHASDDLPPLFGMTGDGDGLAHSHGRQVWLQQGIGSDDEIIAMVLDQVAAAGAAA